MSGGGATAKQGGKGTAMKKKDKEAGKGNAKTASEEEEMEDAASVDDEPGPDMAFDGDDVEDTDEALDGSSQQEIRGVRVSLKAGRSDEAQDEEYEEDGWLSAERVEEANGRSPNRANMSNDEEEDMA